MAIREAGRTAIAIAGVAIMGGTTLFAVGGLDGISSASAASISTTSTLVTRPATATTTTTTRPSEETGITERSVPTSTTTSTTTTIAPDPYAWLERIPASGQTFLGVSTATGSLAETAAFAEAAGKAPDVVMITRS